jgi:5'(3')-deoxyribonucleotidase
VTVECILLDMDGVIANFIDAAIDATGVPISHSEWLTWNAHVSHRSDDEFWQAIADRPSFWLNIKPYPWAKELFEMCREVAPVVFCSTPVTDPKCASQKIEWLRTHGFMAADGNDYILTHNKGLMGHPSRVLIDDGDHNIKAFEAAGGKTILFPQPWNAAGECPAEDILATVKSGLSQLTCQKPQVNVKDLIGVTKPPQHCIPLPVLWEIGMAMFEGGWKYRDHNYRKIGVQASVYYDAARRHLDAWWEGEDIDQKSGLNHITKVMSCLTVLRDCMMQSEAGAPVQFQDDRPPKSCVTMEMAEAQFKVILERLQREHGDCKPPYTEIG